MGRPPLVTLTAALSVVALVPPAPAVSVTDSVTEGPLWRRSVQEGYWRGSLWTPRNRGRLWQSHEQPGRGRKS